jgi:hypothetical protein
MEREYKNLEFRREVNEALHATLRVVPKVQGGPATDTIVAQRLVLILKLLAGKEYMILARQNTLLTLQETPTLRGSNALPSVFYRALGKDILC